MYRFTCLTVVMCLLSGFTVADCCWMFILLFNACALICLLLLDLDWEWVLFVFDCLVFWFSVVWLCWCSLSLAWLFRLVGCLFGLGCCVLLVFLICRLVWLGVCCFVDLQVLLVGFLCGTCVLCEIWRFRSAKFAIFGVWNLAFSGCGICRFRSVKLVDLWCLGLV